MAIIVMHYKRMDRIIIPIMSKIPAIPDEIINAVRREDLVVFIGSGVSQIIGCPNWMGLASKYLDHISGKISYFEKVELSKFEPRKLLSICKKIAEEEGLPEFSFKQALEAKEDKKKDFGDIYQKLYSFNSIFVTTNYDTYLDDAAHEQKPLTLTAKQKKEDVTKPGSTAQHSNVIHLNEDITVEKLNNGNVIHIHGSIIDETGIIMTLGDYFKIYQPDNNIKTFLNELFQKKTVLFLGYGLEEYEILEFMINKQNVKGRHYMLIPMYEEQRNLLRLYKKYYEDMNIELIPYFISKRGYEELYFVIEEWSKAIGPQARSKTVIDKLALIDEVL